MYYKNIVLLSTTIHFKAKKSIKYILSSYIYTKLPKMWH